MDIIHQQFDMAKKLYMLKDENFNTTLIYTEQGRVNWNYLPEHLKENVMKEIKKIG